MRSCLHFWDSHPPAGATSALLHRFAVSAAVLLTFRLRIRLQADYDEMTGLAEEAGPSKAAEGKASLADRKCPEAQLQQQQKRRTKLKKATRKRLKAKG